MHCLPAITNKIRVTWNIVPLDTCTSDMTSRNCSIVLLDDKAANVETSNYIFSFFLICQVIISLPLVPPLSEHPLLFTSIIQNQVFVYTVVVKLAFIDSKNI